jgi:hypothetical protein
MYSDRRMDILDAQQTQLFLSQLWPLRQAETKGSAMSVPMLTIVLPDGSTEYRSRPETPSVGDDFRHLNQDYVVDTVGHDDAGRIVVTLRRTARAPRSSSRTGHAVYGEQAGATT